MICNFVKNGKWQMAKWQNGLRFDLDFDNRTLNTYPEIGGEHLPATWQVGTEQ